MAISSLDREQVEGRATFTILAVDDSPEIRGALDLALREVGYRFVAATDGDEGLRLAEEKQPDLILLDLMLPRLDGYEVCRRLKASSATRRIPVIFLTARSAVVDRVQGLAIGAVDYIAKPFDTRELLARVEVALRTKQAIDELERANRELRAFSVTDSLTGLYNRVYFEESLAGELSNGARRGVQAACLLLDLDRFKRVNDELGHRAGDAVLRQFATLIRQHTRKSDIAARLGGDEFALLLVGVTDRAAEAAAEKLRALVETTSFQLDDDQVRLTTSVGVVSFTFGEGLPGDDVLAHADRALYQAKRMRNRVALDMTGMDGSA